MRINWQELQGVHILILRLSNMPGWNNGPKPLLAGFSQVVSFGSAEDENTLLPWWMAFGAKCSRSCWSSGVSALPKPLTFPLLLLLTSGSGLSWGNQLLRCGSEACYHSHQAGARWGNKRRAKRRKAERITILRVSAALFIIDHLRTSLPSPVCWQPEGHYQTH